MLANIVFNKAYIYAVQHISDTDLILNADGSVYHLNLLPGDIAETVILVGDPDRVPEVSKHFDNVTLKKGKREFITHTGYLKSKNISVVSTGIGTDNIDIVLNELDALFNVDLRTRLVNENLLSLNLIRIGTSGAVQPDIPVDSLLVSSGAIGLDSLMNYYTHRNTQTELNLINAFENLMGEGNIHPYFTTADTQLLSTLGKGLQQGITITAPGFYSPQGRVVRAETSLPNLFGIMQQFESDGKQIANLEMETAGIYGLAAVLGHKAISFNVILANRATNVFSKTPVETMEKFIKEVLNRVTA